MDVIPVMHELPFAVKSRVQILMSREMISPKWPIHTTLSESPISGCGRGQCSIACLVSSRIVRVGLRIRLSRFLGRLPKVFLRLFQNTSVTQE